MIIVIGKRWFNSNEGNTYHTATVYVNGQVLRSEVRYGYDDMYKQTAHKMLLDAGINIPQEYFDFVNVEGIEFDVTDVSRKKDL